MGNGFEDHLRDSQNDGPRPFDRLPPDASQNLRQEVYRAEQTGGQPQGPSTPERQVFGPPEMPPAPVPPQMDMAPGQPGARPMEMGPLTRPDVMQGQPDVMQQQLQDRVPQRMEQQAFNSIRSPQFDNPISHLENAKALMGSHGIRAAEREYFAAIRAADNIDQREVAAERAAVQAQLQRETDAARKRELLQYDSTLSDMQRAPGFTRANLAFAYMACGYQSEGVKLLIEAARLDPQMEHDPNFIRHLRSFDRGPQMQRPPLPGQPQTGYQPEAPRGPPAPGAPVTGGDATRPVTPGDATRPQTPGDNTTTQPYTAGGDRTTTGGDRTPMPSGTNRPDSPNWDDPYNHLEAARQAFVRDGRVTDAVRANYDKAINAADTLDRAWLQEYQKQLNGELERTFTPELQARVEKLSKEIDDMYKALPETTRKQLEDLEKELANAKPEDQAAIVARMKALAPELFAKQDELNELSKKTLEIMAELKQVEDMLDAPAKMRFALASAYMEGGDTTNAKKYLEETVKLDPTAAADPAVKEMAEKLGMTLEAPPTRADQPLGPEAEASARAVEGVVTHLQEAHRLEKEQGFAAAKPLYEKAIQEADKINKDGLQKSLDQLKAVIDDKSKPAEERAQAEQLLAMTKQLMSAPYLVRIDYAVALNNAGDQAKAKEILQQAAQIDPEMAKSASFAKLMEVVDKPGEKITLEALEKLDQDRAVAEAQKNDPMFLFSQAQEEAQKGNLKSAEELYKQAVEAADKLDLSIYRERAAAFEQRANELHAAGDYAAAQQARELKQYNELYVKLPWLTRQGFAEFYAHPQVMKGDEAKALLEQALQKNPELKDDPTFRADQEQARLVSRGTIEKSLDYMKSIGKGLLVDGTSGLTGMAIAGMFPARGALMRLAAIGTGMGAAGVTHYGMSNLVGQETTFGKSMLWGSVDALAFMAGGAVHKTAMARYEARVGMNAATNLTALTERKLIAGEATSLLGGRTGRTLLEGTGAAMEAQVSSLTKNASALRNAALQDMPLWKSLPLRVQSHVPGLWRVPTSGAMAEFRSAKAMAGSLQGSRFQYLNPVNAFANPMTAGSQRQFGARQLYNRMFQVDAPSIAAMSTVFRAPREVANVGTTDENGNRYTWGDAAKNTVTGVATDTAGGVAFLGMARPMFGHLFKHSGAAAEVNPLVRPAPLPEGASVFAKAGQVKNYMGYGLNWGSKKIGDGFTSIGRWVDNPEALTHGWQQGIARGAGTVPLSTQLYSPAYFKYWVMSQKMEEEENLLRRMQAPLEDSYPARLPEGPTETTAPSDQTAQPQPQPQPAGGGGDRPSTGTDAAPRPGDRLPE